MTKHRGPAPIVLPKKVSDWIRESSTNYKVNDYKVGGGKKQK